MSHGLGLGAGLSRGQRRARLIFFEDWTGSGPWPPVRWDDPVVISGSAKIDIKDNRGRLEVSGAPMATASILAYKIVGNMDLTLEFQVTLLGEQFHEVVFCSDDVIENCYTMTFTPSAGLVFEEMTATTRSPLGTAPWAQTTDLQRLRVRKVDSDLRVKVWDATAPEPPDWGIVASDSAHQAGRFGFRSTADILGSAREIMYDHMRIMRP